MPMGKYVVFALLLFTACTADVTYEKLDDGVLLHLDKGQLLKLQVVSEKIIRVVSAVGDSLPQDKSLVVVGSTLQTVPWTLEERGGKIILSTTALKASVTLHSGAVAFMDSTGHVILQEKAGGGKSFKAYTVDQVKTFQIQQVFESPDDEAFYGLGQHQEGAMNYKGKDVSLFQYNTKVAVPFLVSNKNYGILWDNYSLTKFGDSRDYKSLSKFKLYDKDGQPGGLTANYVSKDDPTKVFVHKLDTAINYEFLTSLKDFPSEFPIGKGLVYWDGFIESDYAGIYKFLISYAGYTKIWIDGKVVADHWRQAWNPGTLRAYLPFEKNTKYPIKIEWNPDGGESYLSIKWLEAPADQNKLSFFSEAGDGIDYYFVYGKDLDEVIGGYRTLTGRAPIFPKWALGLWQSRERYKTQDELLGVAEEFRKRKIPFDNIVLDWFYWKQDQWGSQQFDPERFPDPAGMIKKVHEKYNAHFMISVWPKFYEGTENYNTFDSKGWLYKANITNRQKDWVGPGYVSTFYDAFNPEARKAFWKLLEDNLYPKGIDAWWLDASEPDILSNASIENRKLLMSPTALGSSTKYFNAYPLVNVAGIYEGLKEKNPDQRIFILTRSGFAGTQRYAAAVWSGDIASRWQDFKTQISAGLNFSLSGIPYWTTDIGGFSVERRFENAKGEDLEEWREQMTRWFQFSTFCPLFRVHGQYPFREMYNVAPESHEAYQTMLYYDKLRYRLMPYIYSLAGKTYHDNYTIMRALAMDFSGDNKVLGIDDEYLFGPSLLIAPVTAYKARSREVYLPAGAGWYDFHTGKYYEGGQSITADAPYSKMPVFVKSGSILPAGPEIQYVDEKPADPITIYVFTGADGKFVLYEDEGTNYNYEKGQYSKIPMHYSAQNRELTIGHREGAFSGMLSKRTFQIIWVTRENPAGVTLQPTKQQNVAYSGDEIRLKH
ncbi:MAG: DUF5110 domain-containing protein [Cyclobacteriaceae bacterium]|nr:DUF5110 domain-containing protein [Cyclobacteriaceae bacterium]